MVHSGDNGANACDRDLVLERGAVAVRIWRKNLSLPRERMDEARDHAAPERTGAHNGLTFRVATRNGASRTGFEKIVELDLRFGFEIFEGHGASERFHVLD